MKHIAMTVCLVVLVLAVAVQAQTQAQPISESVEQELIKLENSWMEAFLKSDIAFLVTTSSRVFPMVIFQRDGQNLVTGFIIDSDPVRDLVFKKN